MQLTDLNIGVLFILGLSGMGVYGVALAGWASNNKYALLGGLRSSAQMISYELPMAMAIAAPLLMLNYAQLPPAGGRAGRLLSWIHPALDHLSRTVPAGRSASCYFWSPRSPKPIACRSICRKRKMNWSPDSIPNIRSMKFAAFFMAEYANMVTVSCVATLLFLGGWQPIVPGRIRLGIHADVSFSRSPV